MAAETCFAPSCNKPGTLLCTGCTTPASRYCSQECQKREWKTHKKICAAAQKFNCFLIRALVAPSVTDKPKIADHMEPFNFAVFGNARDKINELRRRLGWKDVGEVGKFYDYRGSDILYYYVYGTLDKNRSSFPKNEVVSRCTGWKGLYGDVAVIRSGPTGYNDYSETFTKAELVKALQFYEKESWYDVFAQREAARGLRHLREKPEDWKHNSNTGRTPSSDPTHFISTVNYSE
ncbi:hypothetical protein B7463_g8953, partial [Scytalidium lignicola]